MIKKNGWIADVSKCVRGNNDNVERKELQGKDKDVRENRKIYILKWLDR